MNAFDKFLVNVQKPARYIGGEINSIVKDFDSAACKIAFCFAGLRIMPLEMYSTKHQIC